MYYDVCESMVNIRGTSEVGNAILNECVFESGNLLNLLDLWEGVTIAENIWNEMNLYKSSRNSLNVFPKTDA